MTYRIDDGFGQEICDGLNEHNVWTIARQKAYERGESVYVFESGAKEPVRVSPEDETRYQVTLRCGEEHDSAALWAELECYDDEGLTLEEATAFAVEHKVELLLSDVAGFRRGRVDEFGGWSLS